MQGPGRKKILLATFTNENESRAWYQVFAPTLRINHMRDLGPGQSPSAKFDKYSQLSVLNTTNWESYSGLCLWQKQISVIL